MHLKLLSAKWHPFCLSLNVVTLTLIIRATRAPAFKFWKFLKHLKTQYTFWSWLIRCVNKKWVWLVLWRYRVDTIWSTDRWMDRWIDEQSETSIPLSTLLVEGIIIGLYTYNRVPMHSGKLREMAFPWKIREISGNLPSSSGNFRNHKNIRELSGNFGFVRF